MENARQSSRMPYREAADFTISLIPFRDLERVDLTVHALDVSDGGVGIVTKRPIQPGLVWFQEGAAAERRGGVVAWSKMIEPDTYRAGIRFISLPTTVVEAPSQRVRKPHTLDPLDDPGLVTAILVEAVPVP